MGGSIYRRSTITSYQKVNLKMMFACFTSLLTNTLVELSNNVIVEPYQMKKNGNQQEQQILWYITWAC